MSTRFPSVVREQLLAELQYLYGDGSNVVDIANQIESTFSSLIRRASQPATSAPFDESTIALITYADMVREPGRPPLQTLARFLRKHFSKSISMVHLLPFFPYSSDHGFSVLDYNEVDPNLGSWKEIKSISERFDLVFDLVLNHVSSRSKWFRGYLSGDPDCKNDFIEMNPDQDYGMVFRPRESKLFTSFERSGGSSVRVWTTFGPDQVDLNYKNPKVLIRMLEVVANYIQFGAKALRLDAVGFLWKEGGTSCIHLGQTHSLIRAIRLVVDSLSVPVQLIAETNVPHEENLTYFGENGDEAHVVYQFALPPLVLNSFVQKDATALSSWARELQSTWRQHQTFLNFLASHDGVGVQPVRNLLTRHDIQSLADHCLRRGGNISYKTLKGNEKVIYELNINYLDAIAEPGNDDLMLEKFLLAHSIVLTMPGVPALYFHSMVGSRNNLKGVRETGENRMINRETFGLRELENELKDEQTLRHQIHKSLTELLVLRKSIASFHPKNPFRVLDFGERVFALERFDEVHSGSNERVLALHNFSSDEVSIATLPEPYGSQGCVNLVTKEPLPPGVSFSLSPAGFAWLGATSTKKLPW